MKIAKMSIGQAVDKIPGVNRKQRKTRVDQIRKALTNAKPGAILPVYTGSPASAANLALTLRKSKLPILEQAVVRRHIVYVQKVQAEPAVTSVIGADPTAEAASI